MTFRSGHRIPVKYNKNSFFWQQTQKIPEPGIRLRDAFGYSAFTGDPFYWAAASLLSALRDLSLVTATTL